MKSATSLTLVLILIGAILFPANSLAQQTDSNKSRSDQLRTAEQLLSDGDNAGALAIYESFDSGLLAATDHYNQGVALYRRQRLDESAEAFRQAAAASNPELAARARFNLGNSHYARALAAIDSQDPEATPAAMEALRSAIESYRSALRIASADDDARFNLELASKLMRQLEQQQQESESQQNGESPQEKQSPQPSTPPPSDEQNQSKDQQQESSSSDNQEGKGNQQASEEVQPGEQQQDKDEHGKGEQETQEQPSQDPSQEQPGESESGGQNETQSEQPQPNEQSPPPDSSDAAADDSKPNQSPDQSDDQQREGEGTPEQTASDANEANETPAGELTAANESQNDQAAGEEPPGKPGQALQMTQEEARKLLQAIRDRDMLRRLRRRAADQARQIPVERDW